MKILTYNQLNTDEIPHYSKVKGFLENDDFYSAQVKKIDNNRFCARLDKSNRLLFALYRCEKESYILVLEWIIYLKIYCLSDARNKHISHRVVKDV